MSLGTRVASAERLRTTDRQLPICTQQLARKGGSIITMHSSAAFVALHVVSLAIFASFLWLLTALCVRLSTALRWLLRVLAERGATWLLCVPPANAGAARERRAALEGLGPNSFVARMLASPNTDGYAASLPPPYPTGWYALGSLAELDAKGASERPVAVSAAGRSLIVWMHDNGNGAATGAAAGVTVADAYCPHLGASLAGEGGGMVVHDAVGDGRSAVRCAFHGFEFGQDDGRCVKAYGDVGDTKSCARVPGLNTYPTEVKFGLVWAWIANAGHCSVNADTTLEEGMAPTSAGWTKNSREDGADGRTSAETKRSTDSCVNRPTFGLISLCSHPDWEALFARDPSTASCPIHSVTHDVHAHIRDIPENAADVAHLRTLHSSGALACVHHVWEFEWVGPSGELLRDHADANGTSSEPSHSSSSSCWGEHLGPDVCRAQFVSHVELSFPVGGLGARVRVATMQGRVRQCGPGALTVVELEFPPWCVRHSAGAAKQCSQV